MRDMDNGGLQYPHGGGDNGGFQNSFSAVLQEIFLQAQTEIEARNRNVGSQFRALSQSGEFANSPPINTTYLFQPPLNINTCRYEPLVDPALSYISGILADDDESFNNTPFLSHAEYMAYQAKATEVAAILKEDSPTLPLKIDGGNPTSPDSDLTSTSEDSYPETLSNFHLSYLDIDSPCSFSAVPEASRNELLLTGLRGPVPKPTVNFSTPYSLEASSAEGLCMTQIVKGGSQDDIGLRSSHGHKSQRPAADKTGKGLKPRREKSMPRKKSGGKARSGREGEQELVDINDLLVQCAQAVGVNNIKRAMEILNKVKKHCSPYGNGAERLAYYFAEAMDARFSGTGWPLYLGLLRRRPTSAEILRATYLYMSSCPFVKASHYFINESILNVAKRASKLHILELQVDGFQYPSLFKALADRPGGPPEVHVIGLGFPHYSMLPAKTEVVSEAVQRMGRQLTDCAAACGVPFQYTAWAGIREDLRMQDFVSPFRSADEVLVILSTSLLRYVMDETLDSSVLRSKLLKQGRDINPDVYVQGIVTGSYSTPFFTRRFREALFHFESVFDMLETFINKDTTDRLVFESEILGKAILHIVACEGTEVIERIDKYKHWQAVTEEVGFQQLPLDEEIKNNVHVMLKSCHKEYTVAEDSQYLLMGWKGRMLHAMSTWKASPEESF
ncbi:hypothetical protein GOP47_0023244 [Adiantum capillus-veneris]|uniref:Uncharacterized protein n=1 Tax=Adiantum capillus-veneris TaxID=13818 RepID=A0A9D4U7D1_ADICA|nr:hypothetical protein GOP47_0023244 [Adiantum capillus-veneris]